MTGALTSSAFADNTVVIFTADHGDYGGSHGLHGKGNALYDEAICVPLYIGFPGQQNMVRRSFVCSSVDVLPFLYTLALGNDSWRNNGCDIINYLNGREAIMDAIMLGTQSAPQRRLSSFPLTNPQGSANWQQYQPYVLHTTDELGGSDYAYPNEGLVGTHAVALRTVDNTLYGNTSGSSSPQREVGPFGGGKLGIYSYWQEDVPNGSTAEPTQPFLANSGQYAQEFEFYNYQPSAPGNNGSTLPPNLAETGNDYWLSNGSGGIANQYIGAYQPSPAPFGSPYYAELTTIYAPICNGYAAALAAWTQYFQRTLCS